MSRRKCLTALLEASRRMLAEAEAGDWQAVTCMQEQRHQLAEQTFAGPVAAEETVLTAKTISEVLEIDKRIAVLAASARDACANDWSLLTRRRHAVKVYNTTKS